jgi:hypothetical protein
MNNFAKSNPSSLIITTRNTSLILKHSKFYPPSAFMYCAWISKQAVFISLYTK